VDWQPGQPEYEWRTVVNPDVLLNIVCPTAGYFSWGADRHALAPRAFRRLQLYACACTKLVWELLPPDARSAVLVRERFADGRATAADLRAAALRLAGPHTTALQYAAASAAYAAGYCWDGAREHPPNWFPTEAARSAAKALACRVAGRALMTKEWHAAWNRAFAEAREHQAELVRDIFPPPGYAPAISPDWRTSTVVALARQMDETGDFSAVPILADALQDAGCDDELMLDRCRAPSGIYCRGNWVVDLVLGRE
jgi:hypothetical protein